MKIINISFTDLAIASELKDVMRGRQAIKIGNPEFFGVDLNFHCNGGYMKASEAVRLPWNGEGLPPVGIECEIDHSRAGGSIDRVTIIAHITAKGLPCAAYQLGDEVSYATAGLFLPLRTPEQREADGMAEEIKQLSRRSRLPMSDAGADAIALGLVRYGYRKTTE